MAKLFKKNPGGHTIVKVALGVIIAIILFSRISFDKPVDVINGYSWPASVYPRDTATFYIQPESSHKKALVNFVKAADSTLIEIKSSLVQQDTLAEDAWKNGFGFQPSFTINITEAGLYYAGDIVPFVVKSEKPVSYSVLVPIINFQAMSNEGGRNFYAASGTGDANVLSLNRPVRFKQRDRKTLQWYARLDANKGFVTDVDLHNGTLNPAENGVLIFPLAFPWWTREMLKNFVAYLEQGGSAILVGSPQLVNFVRFNPEKRVLAFYPDSLKDPELATGEKTAVPLEQLRLSAADFLGASYLYSGYSVCEGDSFDLSIRDKNGMKETVRLKCSLMMGAKPGSDLTDSSDAGRLFSHYSAIAQHPGTGYSTAREGGIYRFFVEGTNGQVLVIGPESWNEFLQTEKGSRITRELLESVGR